MPNYKELDTKATNSISECILWDILPIIFIITFLYRLCEIMVCIIKLVNYTFFLSQSLKSILKIYTHSIFYRIFMINYLKYNKFNRKYSGTSRYEFNSFQHWARIANFSYLKTNKLALPVRVNPRVEPDRETRHAYQQSGSLLVTRVNARI